MYSDFIKTIQNNTKPMPPRPIRRLALVIFIIAQLSMGIALTLFAASEAGSAEATGVRVTKGASGVPVLDINQFKGKSNLDKAITEKWIPSRVVALYKQCNMLDSAFIAWKRKVPLDEPCEGAAQTTNYWVALDAGQGQLVMLTVPYVIPLDYIVWFTMSPTGSVNIEDVRLPGQKQ